MKSDAIAVIGAAGHTGKFVVAELARRGVPTIAIARKDADVHDPASLDRALAGAGAIINVAGPFLDTAAPVIDAALRSGIHYLDVTAEQPSARSTFERYDDAARSRGIAILPAAGFYGGLGDLLATAAIADWTAVDDLTIFIALDSWLPTEGTRKTGARNTTPRVVLSAGSLRQLQQPRTQDWEFPPPFGKQEVVEVPLSETILIARHLPAAEMRNFINVTPLNDLKNPSTPPPTADDERGRSSQVFAIEAVARRNGESRRVAAHGRDIYAITAPLVVEAAQRLLKEGRASRAGCFALGERFDAADFLLSLAPDLTLCSPKIRLDV